LIDLASLLERIGRDLGAQSIEWALVGGIAVSARTEPRFTRDIDLAVSVGDDAEAERVVRALTGSGWQVVATVEQVATRRLAAVRLALADVDVAGRVVDLLFASSGVEEELVAQADELEVLPGIPARVAQVGHLIVLKLLARAATRPQDDVDIAALLATARSDDLRLASEAARLVEARGYARDRALSNDVADLIAKRGT
jgi:predicted nucleotidyltransferase